MKCDLKGSFPQDFTVLAKGSTMKYPIYPIANLCPYWSNQIQNEKCLKISDIDDLNGIRDFFEGLILESVNVTHNNCNTILELAKRSGCQKLIDFATTFISNCQMTASSILKELIQNNTLLSNNNIQYDKELYLSQHYNDILQFPDLLIKLDLSIHMRILKLATQNDDQKSFNFHDFFSFMINILENSNNSKFSVLFSFFTPFDFSIEELERLVNCPNFDESFMKCKIQSIISLVKENREKLAEQEEKMKQMELQNTKLTNCVKEMLNICTFSPEYIKSGTFLIPVNKEWELNGPTKASLLLDSGSIKVASSSTVCDEMQYSPAYLFTKGGIDEWAAQYDDVNSTIEIEFDSPVTANFLSITSRQDSYYREAPQNIQVFAKNKESEFVLLKRFEGVSWGIFETRFFNLCNSKPFSFYKIIFNQTFMPEGANTISMKKLNLIALPNQ